MKPPPEVVDYYERFAEEDRFADPRFRLEFERTRDILGRVLPPAPARIVDVGGAGGAYSGWLAGLGYEVHLVDASARLVDVARTRNAGLSRPITSLAVGDARALPQEAGSADVVLVMGPLYHLPDRADRLAALAEAARVLAPGGLVAGAAVSRFAAALDGLAHGYSLDPGFARMRDRDLVDGQHRNDSDRLEYFTTAYFHRPEELRDEVETAGFRDVTLYGVEGPMWVVAEWDDRWEDPAHRKDLLSVTRALETEPSLIGASQHLLAVGRTHA